MGPKILTINANSIDPTGHWQESDKKYSASTQSKIKAATTAYTTARAKGDKAGMAAAHNAAEAARNSDTSSKSTTNNGSAKSAPSGTLRNYVENGGGTITQSGNNYTATVNGVSVVYTLSKGVMYQDKDTVVGAIGADGCLHVSGNYYNSTFGGSGITKTGTKTVNGKNYVVNNIGGQSYYANGSAMPTNAGAKSVASIQAAFQNSINGGDFDNAYGLQCVDLTRWFVSTYTTLKSSGGDGKAQAANTASLNGLPAPTSVPQPFSAFSVAGGYKGWGCSGSSHGHTGIVLSVDTVNQTCTVN